MRRVEFLAGTDIPHKRVDWLHVSDSIRAQWAQLHVKGGMEPFRGSVAVGYEWRVKVKPPWKKHMKLWPLVVEMASPAINGGEPYPGVCRFVQSDEPRLTVYLEAK